ncbi:MAG: oligosaccharide flippase family protein [Mariprofundaceae bacterium]|nr:oligosaccharide flippase family protein [Mariprofundaceae bacterium]
MQSVPLKYRAFKAFGWVSGGFVLAQMIRLGGNLILTRLLFPEVFGLMAIVYVLMVGMALFSDMGIKQSIIQNKRGDEMIFLNTAWVVQIVRGVLICLVVLLLAYALPWFVESGWVADGSVYADPLLPSILAVFSLTALIQGFESTKVAVAQRHVQLKRVTQIELWSQAVALLVMVIWAMVYHSVWALVAGSLVSMLLRTILSHTWLLGPMNRISWDMQCFKDIFHFGKWVFLLSIIGFFAVNGDRVMLGGLLSPSVLGLYAIAFLIFSSVQMLYNTILNRVVFPAFSEIARESSDKVAHTHGRFQLIADLFLFSTAILLFMEGDAIIHMLYDDRYSAAGSMLSILGLGLIGARYGVVEQLWLATATMQPLFISLISRLIFLLVGVPLGYDLAGLQGSLIAIVMSFFAGWPISFYYKFNHGLINWKYEFIGIPFMMIFMLIKWV